MNRNPLIDKLAQLRQNENRCKLLARLMLLNPTSRLTLPCQEEWFGINLLERDDELPKLPRKQS